MDILSSGNYYKNQQLSGSKVIAWSHTRRFQTARKLLLERPPRRLLDYGCGDGTFLYLNQDLYESAIGIDHSFQQVLQNRERFKKLEKIQFMTPRELLSHSLKSYFDVITCMETLEHCQDSDCQRLLSEFSNLMASQGQLMISVPNEIGLSLLLKQAIRRLSALRKVGDYSYMESYSFPELMRMLFAGPGTQILRPRYELKLNEKETVYYHGHKGFNFLRLKKMLTPLFEIQRQLYSPVPFLKCILNSQVYFICKKIVR